MSDNDREWTAERIAEVRARCETLRIAIEAITTEEGTDPAETLFDDIHDFATGGQLHEDHEALIDAHRERVNALRGAFVAARADLPDALREIERLRAEIADLDATEQQIAIMSRPFADMRAEEVRQEAKGRDAAHDDARTIGQWFECLSTVVERNGYRGRTARETFVKIGCVALKAIRAIDRSAGRPSGK